MANGLRSFITIWRQERNIPLEQGVGAILFIKWLLARGFTIRNAFGVPITLEGLIAEDQGQGLDQELEDQGGHA